MTAADPSLRRLSYPLRPGPFSEPSDLYLLPLSAISTSGTGSAENFLGDGYHGTTTHQSVELVGINPGGGQSRSTAGQRRVREVSPNFHVSHRGSGRSSVKFVPESVPYVPTYPNQPPIVEEYYRQSFERRKQVMGKRWRVSSNDGNVFPNATQGTNNSVCVWNPHGPDYTEC